MGVQFVIFVPLFAISLFLLIKAIQRKFFSQIILYLVCVSLTAWAIIGTVISEIEFNKRMSHFKRDTLGDLKKGDTATLEGVIAFRCSDPYRKQDTSLTDDTWNDTSLFIKENYITLYNHVVNEFGRETEVEKFVFLPPSKFRSLYKYLDYKHQEKEIISYKLNVTLKKIGDETYSDIWALIRINHIDSLRKLPPIEGGIECRDSL